ncbi:succinylglutamate desuccinylase [Pseudoalteromonas sp. SSDWG2]|uniref:succinylglutamate desuccinylase n=1 Tax=Pseudoalteromonas sp. SSDWG2 TaxID=3139391 RepID=UPI003BA87F4B
MYLQRLKDTGDFLSITRENEFNLSPEQFTLGDGTVVKVLDTGVIEFTPQNPGNKDFVFSSAVHGNETAPIEICDELIKAIISGTITLAHRVMFIFGNPKSINIGERFVDENLNRLFCGKHSVGEVSNPERERAKKLEQYVEQFFMSHGEGRYRAHYDLHTAIRDSKNEKFAVYPFLHGKPHKREQLQFLVSCGVQTVLLMAEPASTFSYFSSKTFGADAFTIELGKVRPFGENDMSRFEQAKSTLEALITQESVQYPDLKAEDVELFAVYRTINRTHETFSFTFDDNVPNFTGFAKGELLGIDGEQEIRAEVDGEAIIFPNAKVALGQRALLTVIPTELSEDFI